MAEISFGLGGLLAAIAFTATTELWTQLGQRVYVPEENCYWEEWLKTLVEQQDFRDCAWIIDQEIDIYRAMGYEILERPVMYGLLRREVWTRREIGHAVLMHRKGLV